MTIGPILDRTEIATITKAIRTVGEEQAVDTTIDLFTELFDDTLAALTTVRGVEKVGYTPGTFHLAICFLINHHRHDPTRIPQLGWMLEHAAEVISSVWLADRILNGLNPYERVRFASEGNRTIVVIEPYQAAPGEPVLLSDEYLARWHVEDLSERCGMLLAFDGGLQIFAKEDGAPLVLFASAGLAMVEEQNPDTGAKYKTRNNTRLARTLELMAAFTGQSEQQLAQYIGPETSTLRAQFFPGEGWRIKA